MQGLVLSAAIAMAAAMIQACWWCLLKTPWVLGRTVRFVRTVIRYDLALVHRLRELNAKSGSGKGF